MIENTAHRVGRLVPELPAGDFIDPPVAIDRFLLRIGSDGTIYFKSTRPRIEEFLRLCAETGLDVQVDHISRCG